MVQFVDLPIELLPHILNHIIKPHHLSLAALVNSAFHHFAVPVLYERIYIYAWQREGKIKVLKLFDTLSRHPRLAQHVHRLEIRDFPKAITSGAEHTLNHVLHGLQNCINLQACTWTRDGSLSSGILEALQSSSSLRELEINGHSEGNYRPDILLGFTNLTRISIIMPGVAVIERLPRWLELTGHALQSLTLICKSSVIVTDTLLETISSSLSNLRYLYLTGCPRITHRGAWAVVSKNISGLRGLGLEGVSPRFDMAEFSQRCTGKGALRSLESITLTVPGHFPLEIWMDSILELLSQSSLETFQVYSAGAFYESPPTTRFWSKLVEMHAKQLICLSVHRMLISLDAIDEICERCSLLKQLFIVVEPGQLHKLAPSLAKAHSLRSVHINYPLEAGRETLPVLPATDALEIVERCNSTLIQFGCNARVWQVGRRIEVEDGTMTVRRTLFPYERPDVPEAFLVVRT